MLGIDHQHERHGSKQPESDGGVSDREQGDGIRRTVPRRSVCVDGADAGTTPVCGPEPGGKGSAASVSGANDGVEPRADHTPDRELHRQRAGESGGIRADEVRDEVHPSGRGTAGLRRQEPWKPERAGDQKNTGARVRRIRAACVRAPGGHFGSATLPLPQLGGLPQEEHHLRTDAPLGDPDRRAAQTAPTGQARLFADRHCTSGRPGRCQGYLSHQCGR